VRGFEAGVAPVDGAVLHVPQPVFETGADAFETASFPAMTRFMSTRTEPTSTPYSAARAAMRAAYELREMSRSLAAAAMFRGRRTYLMFWVFERRDQTEDRDD
jgi:hypothetical protein